MATYILTAIIAVRQLPTLVPVKPSISDSYLFGYNNRAGIMLLLALVVGAAVFFSKPVAFHLDHDERSNDQDLIKAHLAAVRISAQSTNQLDLDATYPGAKSILAAPVGHSPNAVGNYASPRISTGFYYSVVNIATPEQVTRKIDELRNSESQILLPADFPSICMLDPQLERRQIKLLFLSPYAPPLRHSESLMEPLCTYIKQHYRAVDPATDEPMHYGLWERR